MSKKRIPFYPLVSTYVAPLEDGGGQPPVTPDDFALFVTEGGLRLIVEAGEQVFTPEQEL